MISLIAACDENNVIGFEGDMPWHLPSELAYFKKMTTGHSIIMGRKTFESIGRPLPKRENIVLTAQKDFRAKDVVIFHTIDEILDYCALKEEVFVIGGETLYRSFLPHADRIYLTRIHHEFLGDTFFPEFDEKNWKLLSERKAEKDLKNKYDHTFFVYEQV